MLESTLMASLMVRAFDAFKTGGSRRLGQQIAGFGRRRYFRALSRIDAISADVELRDPPQEVLAACMYKVKARVLNKSKVIWNTAGENAPAFAIAASFLNGQDVAVEGPHSVLPANIKPGESCEVEVVFEVPSQSGSYRVRIELVRESCYWFSEVGIAPVEIPVTVLPHSDTLLASRIPSVDVTLDITNKCPLKCIQCRKTYFETFDEQQDMNFDLFRKIAAEVFPYARAVTLSSAGEPLMTKNFLEAVELTRSYGVEQVSFISSGLHLNPKRAERILDLGVTRVEFSLDGASAAVYNKIRIGSNFDKVVHNIEHLNHLKKQRGIQIPLMRFNYVLMKSNIHELPDFIDLAARLGVEEVQCQHMVVFTDSIRSEALIYDKERSNYFIELARRRARFRGIKFFHPPLFSTNDEKPVAETSPPAEDGKIWIEENAFDYERKIHPVTTNGLQLCTDPWRKIFIDWQGLVFPCCVWKEEPLGDLRKNTFGEIWNSDRYKALRGGLITGNLGKSCSECSVITGGDINSERSYFW